MSPIDLNWRQRYIEESIRECEGTLAGLKEVRNKHAPINELSDDLLLAVIVEAASSWLEASSTDKAVLWHGIGVCRNWYRITASSEVLRGIVNWKSRYDRSTFKAIKSIQKTTTAPLQLRLELDRPVPELAAGLAQLSERLTWLHITATKPKALSEFFKPFRAGIHLPELYFASFALAGTDEHAPGIPTRLIECCGDSLRHLIVSNVGLAFRPLRGLTSLKLNSPILQYENASLQTFLTLLAEFPHLASLVLGLNSVPSGARELYQPKIRYAKLKFLAISEVSRRALRVLQSIVLPPGAILQLHCADLCQPGSLEDILAILRADQQDLGIDVYRVLRVAWLPSGHLRLTLGRTVDPSPARYRNDLELSIRCRSSGDQKRCINMVAKMLDFRNITWLDATAAQLVRRSIWNRLLRRLPSLRDMSMFVYDQTICDNLHAVVLAALFSKRRWQNIRLRNIHVCGFPDLGILRSKWYHYVDQLAILLNELKLAGMGVNLQLAVCPGYFDNGHFTRRLVEWCEVLVIDGRLLDGTSAHNSLGGRVPALQPFPSLEEEGRAMLLAIEPDAFTASVEVGC